MYFIAIVMGVFAGGVIFSQRSDVLVGCVAGAAIGLLFAKLLVQERRIAALERQAGTETLAAPPGEVVITAATAVDDDSALELDVEVEPEPAVYHDQPDQVKPLPKRQSSKPAPAAKDPGHLVDLWEIVVSYFTGGNVVVRAGVIVLFFGVAFLFKYTAERNIVPIEFRLLGVCLGALAILTIGWRLRQSRPVYALIMQGGGVGILYLTIFAALRLYQLLPAGIALALLVFLSIFSAALAILQDARSLAVIGIAGGFLAPVLTSTGGGSHVVLFSYYAMLNTGILFTAWHKSWRELNLLGFLFTFGIGTAWGVQNYRPEMFAATEPFLILFFLFYAALGVLFARNQPLQHKGYIDSTLIFGTPIVSFTLQSGLTKPYEYGIAISALVMGGLYATLAWMIFKKGSEAMRTLIESFLAAGVIFGTIAIPLALDGRWTSAAWALEGSAIIWVGIRQKRWMARIFGLILQVLAGIAFCTEIGGPQATLAVINGFYLGCLAVALAGFFSSYCLFVNRAQSKTMEQESLLALSWALLWWFGAGTNEIHLFVSHHYKLASALAFYAVSGAVSFGVATRLEWFHLQQVYKALLPVMIGAAVFSLVRFTSHPSIYGGFAAWPLAFVILYRLLALDDEPFTDLKRFLHIGAFLLLVALVTWEAAWWVDHWVKGSGVWELVVLGLVPAALVFMISKFWDSLPWPIDEHDRTYLYEALAPVVIYLVIGSIMVNLDSPGNPWPLPYLPILNPLDLTQILVFIALAFWGLAVIVQKEIAPFSLANKPLIVMAGALIFFWLNAVLIRTTHHWGGVGFNSHAMMRSDLVQTSLSIFWTLSALAVMFAATRKQKRIVWMVGAGLIGVVIAKLFTVDLANNGTVERIVSFIGVGVICLVIGYLAPLPARVEERSGTK